MCADKVFSFKRAYKELSLYRGCALFYVLRADKDNMNFHGCVEFSAICARAKIYIIKARAINICPSCVCAITQKTIRAGVEYISNFFAYANNTSRRARILVILILLYAIPRARL